MAQIPYPNNYDDNFMNIFKRIIDELNAKGYTYDQAIAYAEEILDEAKQTNDINKAVDERLDNIIADSGTSSTEVVDARGEHTVLGGRLNEIDSQLAQTEQEIERLDDEKVDDNELVSTKNELNSNINKKIDAVRSVELKPTLTLIDDDVRNELFTLLYNQVVVPRNTPITSALISSRIGNHPNTITYEQFREMKNSGLVEFVNHTHEHVHLDELPEDEIDYQIRMCEEWLENEGIFTKHLVYPFGRYNETIRRIASKYVNSATIYGGGAYNPSSEVLDSFLIRRVQFEDDLSTIQGYLDSAVANDGWVIINTHSQYETFSVSKMNDIIDYAEVNGIQILKFTDAYEIFKNIIEIRESEQLIYGIGAGGSNNIVESGGNPLDGIFIRFADGTQWCVREGSIDMSNAAVFTRAFPRPFKERTPVLQWFSPGTTYEVPTAAQVHCLYGGGGFKSALRPANTNGSYPNVWRFSRTEDPNAPEVPVTLYALGRW